MEDNSISKTVDYHQKIAEEILLTLPNRQKISQQVLAQSLKTPISNPIFQFLFYVTGIDSSAYLSQYQFVRMTMAFILMTQKKSMKTDLESFSVGLFVLLDFNNAGYIEQKEISKLFSTLDANLGDRQLMQQLCAENEGKIGFFKFIELLGHP